MKRIRRTPRPALAGMVLAGLASLGACGSTPEASDPGKDYDRPLPVGAIALERVQDLSTLPNLRVFFDNRQGAVEALDQSLDFFGKPSSQNWFPHPVSDGQVTHERQVRTLEALREILVSARSAPELEGRLLNDFDFYRSVGWNGRGEVLFTAYCTPIFDGRRERGNGFEYPLYALPADLVKAEDGEPLGRRDAAGNIVPNLTRERIEATDHYAGSEVVWLRDPFEAFVAHVQGSVRIRLADGHETTFGYAGKTEHEYVSIRGVLVGEGKLKEEDANLGALERYFRDHPGEVQRVLNKNPSYVFFTEYGDAGPFGSIGSTVTAYHTVATDKQVFPRGGAVIVDARLPAPDSARRAGFRWQDRARLTFDQDTGGAIRSAGRCDVFLGIGDQAKHLAGLTKSEGELFYFFLKP